MIVPIAFPARGFVDKLLPLWALINILFSIVNEVFLLQYILLAFIWPPVTHNRSDINLFRQVTDRRGEVTGVQPDRNGVEFKTA